MSTCWNSFEPTERCFMCVPLRRGCALIAILGLFFGVFGVLYLISIGALWDDKWAGTYNEHPDIFGFVVFILITNALVFIASLILSIGLCFSSSGFLKFYLWLMTFHIVLVWCAIIVMTILCAFIDPDCFGEYKRKAEWETRLALGSFFYSVIWGYFMVVVNSLRMDFSRRNSSGY